MIGFAYAKFLNALDPIYRSLAGGLVQNITEVMPGEPIVHITDETTEAIAGCNVMRIEGNALPMTWRLLASALANEVYSEILLVEPDMRFVSDVREVWAEDFDDVGDDGRGGQ